MTETSSFPRRNGDIEMAVAIGRIEEKLSGMDLKLDKFEAQTEERFRRADERGEAQWKKISEMDVSVKILQDQRPQRAHWSSWVLALVGVAGFVTSFFLHVGGA